MTKIVYVLGHINCLMLARDTYAVGEYYAIPIGGGYVYYKCVNIQPKIELIAVAKQDIPIDTNIIEVGEVRR